MTYSMDVYLRLHTLMTSLESWFMWLILCVILSFAVGLAYESANKYSKQFLYYLIIFIIGSFCIRVLSWVLLPSPTYLGV